MKRVRRKPRRLLKIWPQLFTGIITHKAVVVYTGNPLCLSVNKFRAMPGDSICVSGICLTLVKKTANKHCFNVSEETISRTSLKYMKAGDELNIEKPLTLGDPIGGHLVYGHVDCVGKIERLKTLKSSVLMQIKIPSQFMRYMAVKGSIAVDGVSLTIAKVSNSSIFVSLIPFTLKNTNFHSKRGGNHVNIEIDIVARYLHEKTAQYEDHIDQELLTQAGYIRGIV